MWPLEFTATPGTSPKFMPCGSFGKSGTESKAISGAVCWASAGPASSAKHAIMNAFIGSSLGSRAFADRGLIRCRCTASRRWRPPPALGRRQRSGRKAVRMPTVVAPQLSMMKRRRCLRRHLHLLTPENVKPGGDNDDCACHGEEIGHVAEHHISEPDCPDDHRVLIRYDDARRRQFQRAVDASERRDR